jgi:DNA-binding NtrC family response regulator
VLERAVITADGPRLAIDLPAGESGRPVRPSPGAEAAGSGRVLTDAEVRRLEADNIRAALQRAGGKVSGPGGAAELLGIKPTTLASRIKAFGLGDHSGGHRN